MASYAPPFILALFLIEDAADDSTCTRDAYSSRRLAGGLTSPAESTTVKGRRGA
jgi:hypothetical protein